MKKIIGRAGTGKTDELIKYAAEHGYSFFTSEPARIQIKAKKQGYLIPEILSYEQESINKKGFVVDDIEAFLNFHTDNYIKGFTITGE